MRTSKASSGLLLVTVLLLSGCEMSTTAPPVHEASYSISYDGNGSESGGPPTDSLFYHKGDSVEIRGNTGNLSRSGFTFTGWNTSSSGTGTKYLQGNKLVMPASNVKLYALWVQNFQAIHFFANGGSGTMTDQTVAQGVPTVLSPLAFTKTGYLFAGWNTKSSGTGTGYADQGTATVGTQDLTLYATWTPLTNTISFQANGGTGTMNDVSTTVGSGISLPSNSFTRTGYNFSRWDTKTAGNGTAYSNSSWYQPGVDSVVLYAQWTVIATYIQFQPNGGDGSMAPLWGDYATTTQLPPSGLTREGYSFVGWTTEANGGGDTYSDGNTVTFGTTNLVLYAQWQPIVYTITFAGSGASGSIAAANVPFGTTYTLPAVTFVKSGHSFTWWSDQTSGGTVFANQSSFTMPNKSFVLYAQWGANSYNVTFHANGGTGTMSPQSFMYGGTAALHANEFSKSGLLFSGWSTTPGGSAIWSDGEGYTTGPADRDLYALWSSSVSIHWGSGSTLTFSPSSVTGTVGQAVTLQADVADASNWRWYVDNVRVSNQSTGTYDYNPTLGFHTISVLVTANGLTLSGDIIVRGNQ